MNGRGGVSDSYRKEPTTCGEHADITAYAVMLRMMLTCKCTRRVRNRRRGCPMTTYLRIDSTTKFSEKVRHVPVE